VEAESWLGTTDDPFAPVLAAAQAGEEWAFTVLFREWNPPLIRYLRARVPAVAEDLASEVWMTAAAKLSDFQGGRPEWRAWLFTLAHRRSIDHHRQASRRRTDPAPPDAFLDGHAADDPAQEAADGLSAQDAISALTATLSSPQAEVLVLRVVAGLDAAEVAQVMGRSPGWVRVTQHRALRRLEESAFANQRVSP
jgi:RNA polymerase sigma-70 factor, ECF subfamily